MKGLVFIAAIALLVSCGSLEKSGEKISGTFAVSCGMCNLDMTGDACALAIEIEDKTYYVEGSDLHDHGDAHAQDGLCTVRRDAKVVGQIKKGVFVAESLELLPFKGE